MSWDRLGLIALAAFLTLGCSERKENVPPAEATPKPPVPAAAAPEKQPPRRQLLLDTSADCELHHRGLVLDFADPSLHASENFRFTPSSSPTLTERGGMKLRRFDQVGTSFDFFWGDDSTELELTAWVQALDSERIGWSIDDRRVGTVRLKPGELQEIDLKLREFPLSRGRHRLSVHLSRKGKRLPSAEIAWVRLGTEARSAKSDRPPARADSLTEVTIGGERKRAAVLREGGLLRCPLWLPRATTRLTGHVGLWGNGRGDAEIRAQFEDGSRKTLTTIQLDDKDEDEAWVPFDVELDGGPRFVHLELVAPRLTSGARLAFGEPALSDEEMPPGGAPRARRVFLISVAGLDRRHSPPSALSLGFPLLHQFAKEAIHFPGYRTTTTSSQAAVASMLLGVEPNRHRVLDLRTRFPDRLPTLAENTQGVGATTGFFTAVPSTFSAFGFDRGFETVEEISPVLDLPAVEPLRRARSWLEGHLAEAAPLFVVLHLRGAHPPFDVTREAAHELAPLEYGGDLDPRRAALQLLAVRSRPKASSRRLPEEDWVRLEALRRRALLDQDAALSSLFRLLRERGAWNDSLVIVTGDVSAGEAPLLPFDEDAALSESQLSVPLFIKFPEQYGAGRSVPGLFAPRDLFATIQDALGLAIPPGSISLGQASAPFEALRRAHVAYKEGHYSTRLGPHLLGGTDGKPPRLCQVDLDPSCSLDRAAQNPLAVQTLWLRTFHALLEEQDAPKSQQITPSEELKAALLVWGFPL